MTRLFTTYRTHILVAVGIAAALGAAWWSLSGETPTDSLLVAEGGTEVAPSDKSLVDTLLQLRAVSLSGTIFSDPSFASLRDFGTQIVPEPVGRPNPFAPFNAVSANSAGTSTELFAPER